MEDTAVQTEQSTGTDQESYVNDAFDSYFEDPKGNNEQAETPKDEKVDNNQEKPEATVQKPDENQPEKQEQPEADLFVKAFSGDDGSFDMNKLVEFSLPKIDPVQAPNFAGTESKQAIDPRTAWENERKEAIEYETGIRGATLGPLEKAYQLIEQGADPRQALAQVYEEQQGTVQKLLDERKAEMEWKKEEERNKSWSEQQKQKELAERSKTNVAGICNALPGADVAAKTALFNRVFYGEDAGGELLNEMFADRYPDTSKYSKEQLDQLARGFIQEITGNGERLQRFFNRAFSLLKAKQIPELTKHVARATEAQVRSNSLAAQKAPAGTAQRPAPSKTKDPWANYFDAGPKTRIN